MYRYKESSQHLTLKRFKAETSSTCHIPTDAWRNLSPILESLPTAWATSDTSAPVASHITLIALILEIRWARNALAACRWKRAHWWRITAVGREGREGKGDFWHVRTRRFTYHTHSVDTRDTLGEERIGCLQVKESSLVEDYSSGKGGEGRVIFDTSSPVASHITFKAMILETRWARNALAACRWKKVHWWWITVVVGEGRGGKGDFWHVRPCSFTCDAHSVDIR